MGFVGGVLLKLVEEWMVDVLESNCRKIKCGYELGLDLFKYLFRVVLVGLCRDKGGFF